ncbi:MAG: AMP-binding protein [Betaproteobacteria bacterium]|jgi:long-chain acyl-CoA synthetase|nr:AMP-binding protein [Betaproteobacteria bacterium]MDH5286576.1 AMP-binding protein [Betaproteobacteria bacterium]
MRAAARNVAHRLARTAGAWPRLPALAQGAAVLADYATLARRAAQGAAALLAAGLARGDRVALASRNHPAYIEALFACWWAGLCAVPVNARLHPRELDFVLADSGAALALVDGEWLASLGSPAAGALREVVRLDGPRWARRVDACAALPLAEVAGDDAAWLFYTSGTTGRPKGVTLTHANLDAMTLAFLADVEPVVPGDAILHPAPLSHGSGLYVLPHVARGAVNVVPESGAFDADEIARLVGAWDRSLFFAAPTMVKRLRESSAMARLPLARLKAIVFGGGPMYVADLEAAFAAFGPRLAQIYGQGESPMTITAMDRACIADAIARGDAARLGSVGTAQLGVELAVGGPDDAALPPGAIGEVLARGPSVMRGYWRNDEATARTLAGGWLHTGDVGVLDADGFLTLKDRSKDLVISGGANVYPREVEEALLEHPDVAEAAVLGRPHPDWGEEVVACVVPRAALRDDAARRAFEAALDAHCLGRIARFKRPRAYVFIDELPKNATGKVLKTELRGRVARSHAP